MPRPFAELEAEAIAAFADGLPDLDQVAGIIAGLADPPGSTIAIRSALDELAAEAPAICADAESVLDHVFVSLGFKGNTANYYSPSNSYLHRVIETRRGIPISLAIVAIEVGRRLGVGIDLVGFPGHVLLGDRTRAERWFDPFEVGRVLDVAGCEDLLRQQYPGARLQPEFTRPLSPSEVGHRMLNNLKHIHLSRGDASAALTVARLAVVLPDAIVAHHIELARLLAATGRFDEAADRHDLLTELDPNEAEEHERAALRLRAHYN